MTAVELAQLWKAYYSELEENDGLMAMPLLQQARRATEAVLEEYRQDVAAALDIQAKASAGHAEKDET